MNKNTKSKMTRKKLIEEIAELQQRINQDELGIPQIFLTDTTPEAIQNVLAEQNGRIAILSDEGNLFDILAGIYTNGKQNLDVFLQGHAGGPLRVRRTNRMVCLSDIAISIGLAVQPAILSEQSDGDRRKFRGKGLLARFLFCYPRSNIGRRDIRHRTTISVNVQESYAKSIKKLLEIEAFRDQHGAEHPRVLGLQLPALESWQTFSQDIEDNQKEGGEFEHLQDFTGKLPGTALRIAGICEIAKRIESIDISHSDTTLSSSSPSSRMNHPEVLIDKSTIEPVLSLCKNLAIHAKSAFELMGDNPTVADAKYAFKWILANAEQNEQGAFFIKQNALHSTPRFKNSKLERLKKALEVLQERHIISKQQMKPTRKPTYIFFVNPAVLKDKNISC